MRPVLAFDGDRATCGGRSCATAALSMAETAAIPLDGDRREVAAAGRNALAALAGAPRAARRVTVALPPRRCCARC